MQPKHKKKRELKDMHLIEIHNVPSFKDNSSCMSATIVSGTSQLCQERAVRMKTEIAN